MVRILLVEDEPALQTMTRIAIHRAIPNAVIEIVDTAAAAIVAIARDLPLLIVSDYDLADGSKGDEILAWIMEYQPLLVSRFLFVSGNPVVEEIHSRSVMKPYSPRALGTELRSMLDATRLVVA